MLSPETSSNGHRDDIDFTDGKRHQPGDFVPDASWTLGTDVNAQASADFRVYHTDLGLEVGLVDKCCAVGTFDDHIRGLESLFQISTLVNIPLVDVRLWAFGILFFCLVSTMIRGHVHIGIRDSLRPDHRRIRKNGRFQIEHRIQQLIFDFDLFSSVFRSLHCFSSHGDHGLSVEKYPLFGKDRAGSGVDDLIPAWEILCPEDSDHSRDFLGFAQIYREDFGMSMRADHQAQVKHSCKSKVPGVGHFTQDPLSSIMKRNPLTHVFVVD